MLLNAITHNVIRYMRECHPALRGHASYRIYPTVQAAHIRVDVQYVDAVAVSKSEGPWASDSTHL